MINAGYTAAAGCALVGLSRFTTLVMKNPQPGTGKMWLLAAAVILVVTIIANASGGSTRRA